jgi:O-antigen/teichoic acid export membrane protein
MQSSIIRRVFKGFGANAYGQLVNVIVQLCGVPVLLHFWGGRLYGEWLILSAIPVYLSMTDLGFAQSAGNDMTQRVARGDLQGALAVFQCIGGLVALCSVGGLAVVTAVLTVSSFVQLLPLQVLSEKDAAWVIYMLAAEVCVALNDGTLHAGFRAGGGYALHTAIDNTTRMVQHGLLWAAAAAGGGPVTGAWVFLCVRSVATPLTALLLVRKYHWLRIGVSHARWSDLRRLFRPAIANLALPLAQSLNIQGMRLAVGSALGPVAVVIFTTLRSLARLILQAAAAVGHAAEPEMAAAFGSGDTRLLGGLYVRATQLGIAMALVLAGILFFAGGRILAVWTSGHVAMDRSLFGWLVCSAVIGTFWSNGLIALKAANRHLRATLYFVIAAGLAVALAGGMLTITGRLADTGLVLLLMDLFMAVYSVPAACRLSGSCWQPLIKQMLNPFRWTLPW